MCGHMCLWFWPRARFFSLSKGESQGINFGVSEEPGWRWRGSTTIDWQLFLKIPSLPSKRREARVMNYVDLLPNGKLILIYCFVTTDWTASVEGESMQHLDGCDRDEPQQQWKGFFTQRSLTRFLCTAFVCTTFCPPYHFSRSISSLHCNPKLVGPN